MTPNRITIHCSATPNGEDYDVEKIRRYHVDELGWSDVGYHLVIQPSGVAQRGRDFRVQGAHVSGYNEGNVGVCLVGTDQFTMDQFDPGLRTYLGYLKRTFGVPAHEIFRLHNEFDDSKTCPNIEKGALYAWYYEDDTSGLPLCPSTRQLRGLR